MVQRFGAFCVLIACLLLGRSGLRGQVPEPVTLEPNPPPVVEPVSKADEFSQNELRESYQRVQEQLRQTQQSIVKNRLEAEAITMAQSRAFAEKLDAIQSLMAAERRRQLELADRAEFEHARQATEIQQSYHAILWVATAFGAGGLLAMMLSARLQWRMFNRLAEAGEMRLQLAAPNGRDTLSAHGDSLSEHTVSQANQRMMSAISRMERRIFELENSAHPMPITRHDPAHPGEKALA